MHYVQKPVTLTMVEETIISVKFSAFNGKKGYK